MDCERPIGFFDSGVGGISVLRDAVRLMPGENYLYYGDNLHAPYGEKTPEEVRMLTWAAMDKLLSRSCKAIVIACNTATSAAAPELRARLKLPIVGMEPALKPAAMLTQPGKVLVMATPMTLRLPKFARLMSLYGQDAIPLPCPGLVEYVENGELTGEGVQNRLRQLLSPYFDQSVKAIVLGCTHFVFLRSAIADVFPGDVPLVDGNEGTVRQIGRRLLQLGQLRENAKAPGTVTLLSSRETPQMRELMERLLQI